MRTRFQTDEDQRSVQLRPDAVKRAKELVAEAGDDPASALRAAEAYLRMFPETEQVALSPDGRTVAFFSTRGGLYTANSAGMNQQKISSATGESLRWEGN
mgnify:CR=1 FL=1